MSNRPVRSDRPVATEYQLFIKNRMPLLREEYPNLTNIEYMRMVATEWTNRKKTSNVKPQTKSNVETIEDKKAYEAYVEKRMPEICESRPNLRTKDYQNLIRQEWLESKK